MEDSLKILIENINKQIGEISRVNNDIIKSNRDIVNTNSELKLMMMEEVFPLKQKIAHFELEIDLVKKGQTDLKVDINKLREEMKEYYDMKLQAKGIVGLIRLLWNIGLIAIIIGYLKNKLHIQW